jgi:hypothetical protein
MRTFATLLCVVATAALLYISYTLTIGLQEAFPFQGYLGFFLVTLVMALPVLCVSLLMEMRDL